MPEEIEANFCTLSLTSTPNELNKESEAVSVIIYWFLLSSLAIAMFTGEIKAGIREMHGLVTITWLWILIINVALIHH